MATAVLAAFDIQPKPQKQAVQDRMIPPLPAKVGLKTHELQAQSDNGSQTPVAQSLPEGEQQGETAANPIDVDGSAGETGTIKPHPRPSSTHIVFKHICFSARKLLNPLADLQVITGIGIIFSALPQLQTITFYHQELILSYWLVTINSFWVIRPEYMGGDNDIEKDKVALQMRRLAILASTWLGAGFQAWVTVREDKDWENGVGGLCYNYKDPAYNNDRNSWFWWTGLVVYILALMTVIAGKEEWPTSFQKLLETWQKCWWNWLKIHKSQVFEFPHGFVVFLSGLGFSLYWLVIQFVPIWSYGRSNNAVSSAFMLFVYIGLNVWNTYDIITLKQSNKHLVNHAEERAWGYGQVLPMIMLLQVVFNAVDIWRDEKVEKTNKL